MKFYQDEAWLWKSYVDEKMSMRQVADEAGCSYITIFRYLKLFGIKRPVSKQPEKPAKPTQTLKQAFDKVAELDKLVKEVEELGEIIKVLEGKPSTYVSPSPSEVEANRQIADGKRRTERYRQMAEDEEYSRRQRSGDQPWHTGNVEEEMDAIMYELGERI